MNVPIMRLPHAEGLSLPAYQTAGAAGMDLHAAVPADEPLLIPPGRVVVVPTGLALALPPGHEAQVRPRSGLATKHRLLLPNSPGTIDSDYRGEVRVPLLNLGDEPFAVTRGMRVAQLIVAAVERVAWDEAASLGETDRGRGGFGSTGR